MRKLRKRKREYESHSGVDGKADAAPLDALCVAGILRTCGVKDAARDGHTEKRRRRIRLRRDRRTGEWCTEWRKRCYRRRSDRTNASAQRAAPRRTLRRVR